MTGTYYSDKFVGRKTSSGEVFRQDKFTAAHKTIPLGTLVLVTNPKNGKQVIVKVNDRCPRTGIIDMTKKAAKILGIGSAKVTVQVLPERFKSVWEKQDSYTKEMENGTLQQLDPLRHFSWPEKPQTPLQPDFNPDTLYDLELCIANTRSDAQKIINNLPIHYQNTAEMIPSNKSLMVKVRLILLMQKNSAESVQKEFLGKYPDCKLVPAKISNFQRP